ncbi:hypothetical protein E2C01_055458 [Portunus trituberculatus]|uniref:Uncharacterized protein n=1 Tax=Portunus trituberculatus TaxID=210409 RepID=A0A5B7GUU5_PORTR|nr:hypothetical protein [Portunus trituberculatus]
MKDVSNEWTDWKRRVSNNFELRHVKVKPVRFQQHNTTTSTSTSTTTTTTNTTTTVIWDEGKTMMYWKRGACLKVVECKRNNKAFANLVTNPGAVPSYARFHLQIFQRHLPTFRFVCLRSARCRSKPFCSTLPASSISPCSSCRAYCVCSRSPSYCCIITLSPGRVSLTLEHSSPLEPPGTGPTKETEEATSAGCVAILNRSLASHNEAKKRMTENEEE